MTLSIKFQSSPRYPELLGIGDKGRQEDSPCILWSTNTSFVGLLQAFTPGTGYLKIRLSQFLIVCICATRFLTNQYIDVTQNGVPGPAASASPGSLLEMQSLRPLPRSAESESASYQDPQVIRIHRRVGKALT